MGFCNHRYICEGINHILISAVFYWHEWEEELFERERSNICLESMDSDGWHIWNLSILHYPIMVIYHYPLAGVILMVILHVFIIKNFSNFFSNYFPKYTYWVIFPFYTFTMIIYEFTFPEHYLIVREEMEMFSFFWCPLSD